MYSVRHVRGAGTSLVVTPTGKPCRNTCQLVITPASQLAKGLIRCAPSRQVNRSPDHASKPLQPPSSRFPNARQPACRAGCRQGGPQPWLPGGRWHFCQQRPRHGAAKRAGPATGHDGQRCVRIRKNGSNGHAVRKGAEKSRLAAPAPAGDHFLDENNKVVSIPDLAPSMLRDEQSGFDAAIYCNDQGQYVVAFRGTDQWFGPEGADIKANGGQALGLTTEQYKQAITLAQSAVEAFGKGNVIFTGHSLGGGLASAAMLATGAPGVTFNAAGLSGQYPAQPESGQNAQRHTRRAGWQRPDPPLQRGRRAADGLAAGCNARARRRGA